MAETNLRMENDYEITQERISKETLYEPYSYSGAVKMVREKSICRTFNFMSGKITTVISHTIYQPGSNKEYGSSAGIGVTALTESFTDQPIQDEIEAMHAALVKLGGKPPALDKIQAAIIPARKFG